MHWITTQVGNFNIKDYIGFTYLVTNLTNNKKYVGKKLFWFSTKKKVKNKTKEGTHIKRILSESDWATYTTSSNEVNAAIKCGEQFKFEMLSLHYDKGNLAYAEVETMIKLDVLRTRFTDGSRAYYNAHIPSVKWLPITTTEMPIAMKRKLKDGSGRNI